MHWQLATGDRKPVFSLKRMRRFVHASTVVAGTARSNRIVNGRNERNPSIHPLETTTMARGRFSLPSCRHGTKNMIRLESHLSKNEIFRHPSSILVNAWEHLECGRSDFSSLCKKILCSSDLKRIRSFLYAYRMVHGGAPSIVHDANDENRHSL